MAIATSFEQVTNNSPDGAQAGRSATEKFGMFGVTPIVQPASANQAVTAATAVATAAATVETLTENSNDSTPDTTIADCRTPLTNINGSGMTTAQEDEVDALFVLVDSNFADLADQQSKTRVDLAAHKSELDKLVTDVAALIVLANQLRSDGVDLGSIKGAA